MQYLLTEEEYAALQRAQKLSRLENTRKMRELCTHIADNMPMKRSWAKSEPPQPWGCIRTIPDHYCDECPVRSICPSNQRFSQ